MSNLDTLSNLFSHIKNGQKNRNLVIEFRNSRIVVAVLNILQENGYIRGYRLSSRRGDNLSSQPFPRQAGNESKKETMLPLAAPSGQQLGSNDRIEILLAYFNDKPAITQLLRISKPSHRIYLSTHKLSSFLGRGPLGKSYGPPPASKESFVSGSCLFETTICPPLLKKGRAKYPCKKTSSTAENPQRRETNLRYTT